MDEDMLCGDQTPAPEGDDVHYGRDFRCSSCDRPIVEGQHYIRLSFALDTDMPAKFFVKPSVINEAVFCTLHCARAGSPRFIGQSIADERVQDTFDPIHG